MSLSGGLRTDVRESCLHAEADQSLTFQQKQELFPRTVGERLEDRFDSFPLLWSFWERLDRKRAASSSLPRWNINIRAFPWSGRRRSSQEKADLCSCCQEKTSEQKHAADLWGRKVTACVVMEQLSLHPLTWTPTHHQQRGEEPEEERIACGSDPRDRTH